MFVFKFESKKYLIIPINSKEIQYDKLKHFVGGFRYLKKKVKTIGKTANVTVEKRYTLLCFLSGVK